MSLKLVIPQMGKNPKTKDIIISVLGYEWPLTPKKIYNIVRQRYSKSVTYQAVYKSLNELVDEGVMVRNKGGYQIGMKWLKELHRFTECVETNYYSKRKIGPAAGVKESKSGSNITILTFSTLFDAEKYLYYLQKHSILNSNEKGMLCMHRLHEWRPLMYMRAEYNWARLLRQLGYKVYVMYAGSTLMEKRYAEFYRKFGWNVRTGVESVGMNETTVFRDTVIQLMLPKDIKDNFEKIFSNNSTGLNVRQLIENVLEKKSDISVIITKNRGIAEDIKNRTRQAF